jgi:hypothetical protein
VSLSPWRQAFLACACARVSKLPFDNVWHGYCIPLIEPASNVDAYAMRSITMSGKLPIDRVRENEHAPRILEREKQQYAEEQAKIRKQNQPDLENQDHKEQEQPEEQPEEERDNSQ